MISNERFYWKDKDLYFKDKLVVSLIPGEKYKKHYHLKFFWRDSPTPEVFNIFNARENSRIYAALHLNEDM